MHLIFFRLLHPSTYPPPHFLPSGYISQLFASDLLFFSCCTGVSSQAPLSQPSTQLLFTFTSGKKNSLALQCSSCFYQRKERAHGDSWIKSKLEVLWRCHFDVQGIFVFPLFDSLCHFSFCKCYYAALHTPSPSIMQSLSIWSLSGHFSTWWLQGDHKQMEREGERPHGIQCSPADYFSYLTSPLTPPHPLTNH